MKRSKFQRLTGLWMAILLMIMAILPAMAEETKMNLQPLLALVKGTETQTPTTGKHEIPEDLLKMAANASLHADASSSKDSDNWEYGVIVTLLDEENQLEMFCTVLLIEEHVVILVTDSTPYDLLQEKYQIGDMESAIEESSYILLPDGTGKDYYELVISRVIFSDSLPLMYIALSFDDSFALGTVMANNPEGARQFVAGYYKSKQDGKISPSGDNLIPQDAMRNTLESGEPFLPGSPVYSADQQKGTFTPPAIGVQARDGYVYSAREVLMALMQQVNGEEETAATATPKPTKTPKPTATPKPTKTPKPTATPKITKAPTEAPAKEKQTDIPETGSTDTSQEENSAKPTATPKKGEDSGMEEQSSLIQSGQIPYWVIGAVVLILLMWFVYRRGKQNAGKQGTAEKVELIRPNGNAAAPVPMEPVRNERQGMNSPQTAPASGIQETMKLSVEETMSLEAKKPDVPSIMASLRGVSGALAGKEFSLHGRTLIGRDPSRCGIVCPREAPEISGVHCAVELAADEPVLILTDEGSSNGTFVGDYQLKPGKPVRLRNGARFHLAAEKHIFEVVIITREENKKV